MKKHFLYTNLDDLSTRSQNIINDLGGIDEVLDFYKKHSGFLSINKVGRFSNDELSSYCQYLLTNSPDKTENLNGNSNHLKIDVNSFFYQKAKEALSLKSQYVIDDFGGVAALLEFYNKYKSFISLFRVSRISNEELIAFCKKLLNKEQELITNQILENHNPSQFEKYINIYESERDFLSTRTKNVLNRLEEEYEYHNNTGNKLEFIKKLFFQFFNFSKLQNLGAKSKTELQSLKDKIINAKVDGDTNGKEYFNKKIKWAVNKALSIHISDAEVDELFIDNEYSFAKMYCLLLFNNKLVQDKMLIVLKHKFFSEINFDRKIIANELNCSTERVRQIVNKLNRTAIPWAANATQKIFENKPYDLPDTSEKNILLITNLSHFVFQNIEYTPNAELSKVVFSQILKKNYKPIEFFISHNCKSFHFPQGNLFVSKKFIEEVHLKKFMEWLDVEIYNFESIAFEYMLDVLIKRFYMEQNIPITKGLLLDLNTLINRIKKQNLELREIASKRLLKKEYINAMLNEAWSFLNERKEGQTTKAILNHLNEKNFETDKNTLLRYLQSRKTTFTYFGNGNWTLKEWNNDGKITGSFRKIVQTLISNRNEPIHISEIYDYLNAIKKVSLHSIRSNLKAETDNVFRFFNCSYYGLLERKYDSYWDEIPKFEAYHLNRHTLKDLQKKHGNALKILSSKYGYPEQHLKFIIDLRNDKYGKGK